MAKKTEVFMKLEVDALTGKTTEREMNADEIAEIIKLREQQLLEDDQRQAKAAARKSALDKLAKLGLTPEEIAAL